MDISYSFLSQYPEVLSLYSLFQSRWVRLRMESIVCSQIVVECESASDVLSFARECLLSLVHLHHRGKGSQFPDGVHWAHVGSNKK